MGLLRPLSSIESVEIAEIDRAKTTPEWRNWQTRQLEGLVRLQAGAGSSPVSGTDHERTYVERRESFFVAVNSGYTPGYTNF